MLPGSDDGETLGIAETLSRTLREAAVQDGARPAIVGALVLARWAWRDDAPEAPELADIDAIVQQVLGPSAGSLAVAHHGDRLQTRLPAVWQALRKVDFASGDALGQLYEALFRRAGGNSIGQYFTPRQLTTFLADLCDVRPGEVVLDPACGTGGFLVAAAARGSRQNRLVGREAEPTTAALCRVNLLLRGLSTDDVRQGDSLTDPSLPTLGADVALLNPPFPHRTTDAPVERFVSLALDAVRPGGRVGAVLPSSVLGRASSAAWRADVLSKAALAASVQLPDDLFAPYASATTHAVVLERRPSSQSRVYVARAAQDGHVLRKSARVPRPGAPNQLPSVVQSYRDGPESSGFGAWAHVGEAEWSAGAHLPALAADEGEVKAAVDDLLRRLAAFYVRHAPAVVAQRRAVAEGALAVRDPGELSPARRARAALLPRVPGTFGESFLVAYGLKELHSREGLAAGPALVVSPSEQDNGCYGWHAFSPALRPPFVTVAQTGSIGEAFVQLEPCAPNDDCLLLVPRTPMSVGALLVAAAALRLERWRFSYGRKLTPARIVGFCLPREPGLLAWADAEARAWSAVWESALARYAQE